LWRGPNDESASHFSHCDLASCRQRRNVNDFDPLNFRLEWEEMMGDADFVRETIQALNSHAAELDSMYRGVMAAAKNRTEIPNIKDIFQGMADASRECDEMLEIYYGDEDPLPPDVRRAIQRVQDGLSNCASAFVAYMAIARLTLG
jgi:hypothetical protein